MIQISNNHQRKHILLLAHWLSIMLLSVFLPAFSRPVFAAQTTTNQTNYIDKYFEIDNNGRWKMNIYLGDQILATVDDTGTTTYPLTDHLGSTSIVTDANGQIIELHDYYPFGANSYENLVRDYRTKKLFTGKETDPENMLYYFGARYYDQNLGKFVSIDPFGQKLNELDDQRLDTFLSDPQRLNSYAYASNNPLNNIDADGNLTIKALKHPGAAAAQLGFWYGFANGYFKETKHYDAAAAFLRHSLSWYPKDLYITQQNQSQYGNIIDSVIDSKAYNDIVRKQINLAETMGQDSFSQGTNVPLRFEFSDAFYSLHKTQLADLSGKKTEEGLWQLQVEIVDKYDFHFKDAKEYGEDWLATTGNNAAYVSQLDGVITPYNIKLKFEHKYNG